MDQVLLLSITDEPYSSSKDLTDSSPPNEVPNNKVNQQLISYPQSPKF